MNPERGPASLPPRLREALARDGGPVRPLLRPSSRTLLVLAVAMGPIAALLVSGLRPDAHSLGAPAMWVPAAVRAVLGIALVALAMREGVPSEGAATGSRIAFLSAAPVALLVLAEWMARTGGAVVGLTSRCLRVELFVAVPAALLAGWLLSRAYTLRPVYSLAAGALGAGLLADAAMHLHCPATDRLHILAVHGGAVAILTAVGAVSGRWVTRSRRPL